jgi:hypothetical protein
MIPTILPSRMNQVSVPVQVGGSEMILNGEHWHRNQTIICKGTTGSRNTPSTGGRGPGIHAPDTRWMVAAAEEYRQGWCRPKD